MAKRTLRFNQLFPNNHNIEKARVCGDYAVFNMPFGEDFFRLICSENLAEYTPTD